MLDKSIVNKILTAQRNDITEHAIYSKLAQSVEDPIFLPLTLGKNMGDERRFKGDLKRDQKAGSLKTLNSCIKYCRGHRIT